MRRQTPVLALGSDPRPGNRQPVYRSSDPQAVLSLSGLEMLPTGLFASLTSTCDALLGATYFFEAM
jgi:hypothetical protein